MRRLDSLVAQVDAICSRSSCVSWGGDQRHSCGRSTRAGRDAFSVRVLGHSLGFCGRVTADRCKREASSHTGRALYGSELIEDAAVPRRLAGMLKH